MKKEIQLHNPQALFNMVRILEEYLIAKSRIFVLLLLPLDIVVSSALFISYLERILCLKVVLRFLQYVNYDLSSFRELFKMIVHKDYVSAELTEQVQEKSFSGRVYQYLKRILKFFWNFLILLLIVPVLPVFWCYNFLAPKVLIGFCYYLVLFQHLHWLLMIYLFALATFLVANTTVPFFFELFVYFKYLFELKRRTFNEIQTEAKTFFLKLYNYNLPQEDLTADEDSDQEKVEGGLYYLFLLFLHSLKNKGIEIFKTLILAKRPDKLLPDLGLENIKGEVLKRTAHPQQEIRLQTLLVPFIAFIITFVIADFLVFTGTRGQGILGSLVLSVVNQKAALSIWGKFMGTSLGYLEYIIIKNQYIPDFLYIVGFLVDKFFYYLFLLWHAFFPFYLNFISAYYLYWWRLFF